MTTEISLPVSQPREIFSPAEAIDDAMEIEDNIRELEQRLFWGDPGFRELETALLLPEAIHKTAVIMGEPIQRERMRGHLTWAAWLKGRLYTREHGLQPLTLDLIVDLHRHTMDEIHESDPGMFRKTQETSGSSLQY